jgi:hypothetical protein
MFKSMRNSSSVNSAPKLAYEHDFQLCIWAVWLTLFLGTAL